MSVLNTLISIYMHEGKFDDAKKLAEELQVHAHDFESDDLFPTYLLNTLSFLHSNTGDVEKSVAADLECLQREEKIFGPGHPSMVGTMGNLAKHSKAV
jgi:pentatricopeptide repeat protein